MAHFEKHFKRMQDIFPRLAMTVAQNSSGWIISGELDICDGNGMYWGTFDIGMFVHTSYPYTVPVVFERSNLIPRELDWHMSPEGECCIDLPHKLVLESRTGLRLNWYMTEKLYPYFANQLHRIHKGAYAGEEWAHHFDGTTQFYREEMNIDEPSLAVKLIRMILAQKLPLPGKPCPCGSGLKLKYCHDPAILMMKNLGQKILSEDLIEFSKLI